MLPLNDLAWKRLQMALAESDTLGWRAETMPGGTLRIDAGVHAAGGLQAGLRLAEISTAGLAQADLRLGRLSGQPWPYIEVRTDHPWLGCFISQSANWAVKFPGAQGMGSGPACLLGMREHFAGQVEPDPSTCAVLLLEASALPDGDGCQALAQACEVPPNHLAVLVAPTSSLAGSAQVAARSVETALHKLAHLGFDLHKVTSGAGLCPLSPPTGDDWTSLGRTNDAMNYGAQVWLAISGCEDAELRDLVERIPSSASPAYGKAFLDLLKDAGGFYAVDPGVFAPAEISLFNTSTGRVFRAGACDEARLAVFLTGAA